MKKILITGGCGFIGSNLIRFLLSNDKYLKIVNIDKITYAGKKDNVKKVGKKRYKFYKTDILNERKIKNILKKESPDYIIHIAAESHVDNSISSPKKFFETNLMGTLNILECIKKNKIKIKKFLYFSTDEVYGSLLKGKANENSCFQPNNPYSSSKAAADLLCNAYYKTYNLPITIIRGSNNYGPCQHKEKLIPKIITRLSKGKKIPIYGNGRNQREWIYVEDTCNAIHTIIKKGKNGESYNVSSSKGMSNLQVAEIILKEMSHPKQHIKFVKDRPGHDFRYSMNTNKIKKMGWECKTPFSEGIRKTINWYLKAK